jgi:hypothetical protein
MLFGAKTFAAMLYAERLKSHSKYSIKPLKPKLIKIIFKELSRTSKKTQHFTITKINWLKLFKEIIAVNSENRTKPVSTKCRVIDC